MEISEITITPVKPHKSLVAFASCVIDGNFYLGNIAILSKGAGGYLLSFPSKKLKNGDVPIYHPINSKTLNQMTREFEEEVNKVLKIN